MKPEQQPWEELERLRRWKKDALQLFGQYNPQAIGKLLGLPLGVAVMPRVEPEIRKLKERAEIAELAVQLSSAWENAVMKDAADKVSKAEADRAELLAFTRWAVATLQGDSGAGHNYWEQFPQYRAGLAAIAKANDA